MTNPSLDGDVSVDYDPETDTYRAGFDSTTIEPSMAVVTVMATIRDVEPTELDPLYDAINPEVLDETCSKRVAGRREGDRTIEFTYLDYEVTVKSLGSIEVQPLPAEATADTA